MIAILVEEHRAYDPYSLLSVVLPYGVIQVLRHQVEGGRGYRMITHVLEIATLSPINRDFWKIADFIERLIGDFSRKSDFIAIIVQIFAKVVKNRQSRR